MSEHTYELPLNERLRTFMRVEFLYKRLKYALESEDTWAIRSSVNTLIEIYSILSRTDVRREVIFDLDRYIFQMTQYQGSTMVNKERAQEINSKLESLKKKVDQVGTGYLSQIRDIEFVSSLLHRHTLPGGRAEFDMPKYKFWLNSGLNRTRSDLREWVDVVKPVCDSIDQILWLLRESAEAISTVAINGLYNHQIERNSQITLVRIFLNKNSVFPEISGGKHLISIRFLNWAKTDEKTTQENKNIRFKISLC